MAMITMDHDGEDVGLIDANCLMLGCTEASERHVGAASRAGWHEASRRSEGISCKSGPPPDEGGHNWP